MPDGSLPWAGGIKCCMFCIKWVSWLTRVVAEIFRRSASKQCIRLQERKKGGERREAKIRHQGGSRNPLVRPRTPPDRAPPPATALLALTRAGHCRRLRSPGARNRCGLGRSCPGSSLPVGNPGSPGTAGPWCCDRVKELPDRRTSGQQAQTLSVPPVPPLLGPLLAVTVVAIIH